MIDSVGNKIGTFQQTLRTQGGRGALVVRPGQLAALRNVSPLVGGQSSNYTKNLYGNLAEFIARKFGITVTDILGDNEGRLEMISADNPTFMERVKNSNGNLEVLGHTVVFEMESENMGRVYLLRNKDNISTARRAEKASGRKSVSAQESIEPVRVIDETNGGHTGPITAIAWGPNNLLASSSEDGTVKVIDLTSPSPVLFTLEPSNVEGYNGKVNCVAFHLEYSFILAGRKDGTVTASNRKITGNWETELLIRRYWPIVALALEQAGFRYAIACKDNKLIKIYGQGNELVIIDLNPLAKGLPGDIKSLDWSSPGGTMLAAAIANSLFLIGVGENISIVSRIGEHNDDINVVRWKPNGTEDLLTGSRDGTVKLINILGSVVTYIFTVSSDDDTYAPNKEPIISVSWHPSSRMFAIASDSRIKVIDAQTKAAQAYVAARRIGLDSISQIAWSPDGNYFAAAGFEMETTPLDAGWPAVSGISINNKWSIRVFRTEDIISIAGAENG